MSLQEIEFHEDRHPGFVRFKFPVSETVSGTGAKLFGGHTGTAMTTSGWTTNTVVRNVVVEIVATSASHKYDPDFVASILQADAAPPEVSFNNVVDMLEWLNRD